VGGLGQSGLTENEQIVNLCRKTLPMLGSTVFLKELQAPQVLLQKLLLLVVNKKFSFCIKVKIGICNESSYNKCSLGLLIF